MAKKNIVSNPPKPQAFPMPASHSVIVGVATGASPLSLEDDEDDICPVCESECTCQNRSRPSQTSNNNAVAVSAHSTSTFNGSTTASPGNPSGLQSLKIKLTLPPNLKHRPHHAQGPSVAGVNPSRNHVASSSSTATEQLPHPIPTGISAHHLARGVVDPSAPKRRGRPPKALVAAREAAKAALAVQNASGGAYSYDPPSASAGRSASTQAYTGKGKHPAKYMPAKKPSAAVKKAPKQRGKTTTDRRLASTFVKGLPRPVSSAEYSDGHSTRFPTFVSAASSSSPSSSSESSDSESSLSSLDSDIEEETRLIVQGEASRTQARKASGSDSAHAHKRWEIRPRQRSVGLGHDDADVESDDSSEGGSEGEDTDDEGAEEDADADTEGGGLEDVDLDDDDETSSRIGITFSDGRGAGWSDDEESSFDADLFFTNLDGSSDSDSSPEPPSHDPFAAASEYDYSGSLTADEEDALLLMDLDPSMQLRRGHGEFEFGLELGELSFGWDGQVFFTSTTPQHTRDFGFQLQDDVEMREETEDETQGTVSTDDESSTMDEVMLDESDGETTEDELIGPDGLPNSRAMMLFRWPTTVSTVDPQSTVSSSASPAPQVPPNASESLRIALASYAGQQGSPAPTPADILAGRVTVEEMEEMEMERSYAGAQTPAKNRAGGAPTMGEFLSTGPSTQASAVIDGKGPFIPSPFPRSKMTRKRRRSATMTDSNDVASTVGETPSGSILSASQSSEEAVPDTQLETSEMSSAEVIDLDDVLDASFLDSDPIGQEHATQSCGEATSMMSPSTGALLSRWDRIPMATFRRTREINKVDGSASDTGLSVFGGMGSINALLTPTKPTDKKSTSARKRGKAKGASSLGSPFDPAVRDGDRTPTSTSPQHGFRPPKKELRREKAMMKRKMMSKPLPPRHQAQFRQHHHHPNSKSRASGSMQRMNSFAGSSSPSFNL